MQIVHHPRCLVTFSWVFATLFAPICCVWRMEPRGIMYYPIVSGVG